MLFLVEEVSADTIRRKDFHGIVGFSGGGISLEDAEFALADLLDDAKGFFSSAIIRERN